MSARADQPQTAPSEAVSFGAFEANFQAGELRKRGLKLRLPDQSFQVLAVLLRQPGAVVTREDLRRRLWSDDTHVAFETNLNTIIHTLRATLDDSAKNPRFIETVPGRGYRFLAPVTTREAKEPPRRRRRSLTAIAAAAVVVAAWAVSDGPTPTAEPAANLHKQTPVTTMVGDEDGASFSPDGSRIVFHWNGESGGPFNIYIKALGAEEVTALTRHPAHDRYPAWSPDGVHIAFIRELPGYRGALMLAEPGEEPRVVAEVGTTQARLAWSPDGRWIVYGAVHPDYLRHSAIEGGIFAVEVASGRSARVTQPDLLTLGDSTPAISPDGRRLAFVRKRSESVGEIYSMAIDRSIQPTDTPRRLTFDSRSASNPIWANSDEILFVSNRGGPSSLWRIAAGGSDEGEPSPVGGRDVFHPVLCPAGEHILFAHRSEVDELWRVDLAADGKIAAPPRRITRTTRVNRGPAFSPDGRWLAFESNRSGDKEIWISDTNGKNLRKVSSFGSRNCGTPLWSPDGTKIAVDSRVEGKGDIFILNAADGAILPLTQHPADDVVPSWSHDGKFVYFASNRTGEFEVWKMPSEGGAPIRITRQGGFHAREAPDGKHLYYAKSITTTSLWRTPVGGGEERQVVESMSEWANFWPSGDGIFFTRSHDERSTELVFQNYKTATPRVLLSVDARLNAGLTATPDGRTLVYSQKEAVESDLVLMDLTDDPHPVGTPGADAVTDFRRNR